jgi:symplekin
VANKLYQLSYISETIEQFATNMLVAAVDQHIPDIELSQSGSTEHRVQGEVSSSYSFNTFPLLYIIFYLFPPGT